MAGRALRFIAVSPPSLPQTGGTVRVFGRGFPVGVSAGGPTLQVLVACRGVRVRAHIVRVLDAGEAEGWVRGFVGRTGFPKVPVGPAYRI